MSHHGFSARLIGAAIFVVLGGISTVASADQFVATPTREVGPFIANQTSPAPSGGWHASDDRTLGASVNGQGGWQTITYDARYDQEIVNGVAHSGGHSWRLSNWFHTGLVNPILTPNFGPVTETVPGAGHVVYDFWFRSASAQADPGTYISTTISDAPGNRMTYLGIFDELPGDADSGCTDVAAGCFHLDAVDVTSGNDAANDGDATFKDHYSDPLQRGVWYHAVIDATFNAGPGVTTSDPALCQSGSTCHVGNDAVTYNVFDAAGNSVWSRTIGSWEAAYYDGRYGNAVGSTITMTNVAFRVSSSADDGSQAPFDTNSVSNRPKGVYLDDVSIAPSSGASVKTSFEFDRYVATTGTDTGTCSTASAPCKTIVYAIAQANAYDTIHVAAGKYAENSSSGNNLIINKPVAIEGAQAGVDARTRSVAAAAETIIVPSVVDAGLTLNSLGDSAVVTFAANGISLDGVVVDGDNSNLTSPSSGNPLSLNGANPDADTGIIIDGSGTSVKNVIVRNLGGSGVLADNSAAGGDNVIQFNRFNNITNPSTWGLGVYAGNNFYAHIDDNLFNEVRIGVQFAENDSQANPGTLPASVSRNEIHATRTGLFMNLFYQNASTWTVSGNHIVASANAGQANQWTGMQVESMADNQTVAISGNVIDGAAVLGARHAVGYTLNNIVSAQSANTAIDGGSVSNVDVGVLATDATNYTGPVNGFVVRNVAFSGVALAALYVEDTNQVAGTATLVVGPGNTFTGVANQLALSGTAATVSFTGGATLSDALIRASGTYFFTVANSNNCSTACTVSNGVINAGIAAVSGVATVHVEKSTFDEAVVIGSGHDNLRLTAADAANAPTLTRLNGGPKQPVLVVAGTSGVAPLNVKVDHLNFVVDKAHATEGIIASGLVDGLVIDNNSFTQTASSSPSGIYSFTNAISVNIDPAHNSAGLPRVDGSNVTITNNTIAGSSSPTPTMFRAGIAVDASVGTISGNHSSGQNHDAIIRFASHGTSNGWLISGNTFGGGGLEFDSPNPGVSPITIDSNTMAAATDAPALLAPVRNASQASVEADFSAMRLIDNSQNLPVTVSNNLFTGYAGALRGVTVENFPNATFSANTFTPFANATDFVSLVVSNKEINTVTPALSPYLMTFTALRNTFNGSGAAGGRAVEFIDDNDANGSAAFGTITFGSNQAADANLFSLSQQYVFNLVNQNCETRGSPMCNFLDYNDVGSVPNTDVRPFRGNVYAVNNLFDGVAPRAMNAAQASQLNAKTFDINDAPGLGLVNYGFTGGVSIDLQGPVSNVQVGVPTDYTAQLANAGNALTENALIHFTISRAGGIAAGDLTIQYFDGSAYQPLPLTMCGSSLCGVFGPQPGGFPVPAGYSATTPLRVTFAVADTFTTQVQLQGVSTNVVYAADSLSTQVVQTAAKIGLALNGPQSATAGATTTGYTARLTNTGGATSENVLVHFVVSHTGGIAAGDITIQYNAGSSYQTIPLTACGSNLCGTFGPPTGFPVPVGYDQTTQLQTIYAKSGVFNITATVDGVSSSMNYASSSLQVTVASGAAANIAPHSSTSITGTAGTSASPLPSVIVTDAAGNPVQGYPVTFVAGANSGTLSGTTQTTDVNGIATLGGWVLGTAATETVTVTNTLNGSPVMFTATVSAEFDLAVSITDNRDYVQYGHTLDYAIVVSNSGPSAASALVTDNLPPELDAAGASWVCLAHTDGATCTASGTGNLSDTPTIPSGGSVTYVLSATVPATTTGETIVNQVSVATAGDSNPSNNTATSTTIIVIFRDGFELSSGSVGTNNVVEKIGSLDEGNTLTLDPASVPAASTIPATWVRALDASGREAFRVDVIGGSDGVLARVVTRDAAGNEARTAWAPLSTAALGVAGKSGGYEAMFVTHATSLQIVIPTWAALPLTIESIH
jgi:uncharacterized repeat protein (TIGR01451 family)